MPTAAELAWAAGLFEGEGCTFFNAERHRRSMILTMTDEDIVRRFHAIVGRGRITPGTPKAPRKPWWAWSVSSYEDILYVGGLLYAALGPRRRAQLDVIVANPPTPKWTPARRARDPEGYRQSRLAYRRAWRQGYRARG